MLSVYLLTFNSERKLEQVLSAAASIADELLVIDSGSSDRTVEICERFSARVIYRKLDNFREQRIFAEESCSYQWVLALDSDEIISNELITEIGKLKKREFKTEVGSMVDGYAIRRDWYFMNKKVNVFYPVKTPEYIVRLFDKNTINHKESNRIIHEQINARGASVGQISAPISHYSCDSVGELYGKINLYTTLAAKEMAISNKKARWIHLFIYPWLIWFRWYILYGGWKDSVEGRILGRYVRDTIYLKYLKLKHMGEHDRT